MIDAIDFQEMLHKFDLIQRPFAIVCNPDNEQELRDKLGGDYLYYSHWFVPKDKIYVVDIKQLEEDIKSFCWSQQNDKGENGWN